MDEITQHPEGEVEVLVEQGGREGDTRLFLDVLPQLAQIGDVGLEIFLAGGFGHGAHDETAVDVGIQYPCSI